MGANREAYQKVQAGAHGDELSVPGKVAVRSYGVCMEFKDEAALKTYADHAAHKQWEAVYEKVRQPGTTSFDILVE
jgi:hypothetical protein